MQTVVVFSFFSLPIPFSRSPILGGFLSLYTFFQSILTLHLLIVQVITRVLVPSATFPNPLWVAVTKAALFKGHFLINAARTLVGRIKCGGDSFSLNCSYTIPPMCVLLYSSFLRGMLWEAAFDGVLFFPSGFWNVEDRIVLGNISRPLGFSSYVLGHFSLLDTGLGPSTKWAGVVKFSGPIIAPQNPTVRILGRRGGFW